MGGNVARVCRKTNKQTTNTEKKTMSHFYGVISQSARKTQPTARAHKTTGLEMNAQSWSGQISTYLFYDEQAKKDAFKVMREPHGSSGGERVEIARGFIDMSHLNNTASE
jgi:hypothetical protein